MLYDKPIILKLKYNLIYNVIIESAKQHCLSILSSAQSNTDHIIRHLLEIQKIHKPELISQIKIFHNQNENPKLNKRKILYSL